MQVTLTETLKAKDINFQDTFLRITFGVSNNNKPPRFLTHPVLLREPLGDSDVKRHRFLTHPERPGLALNI